MTSCKKAFKISKISRDIYIFIIIYISIEFYGYSDAISKPRGKSNQHVFTRISVGQKV